MTCLFCSSDAGGGPTFVATERMYGMGGEFHYRECPECKSLMLERAPELAAFYPADYYAFTQASAAQSGARTVARRVRSIIDRVEWTFPRLAGARHLIALIRLLGVGPGASLLDVGCGSGAFLRRLRQLGMRDLTGVDPFAPASVHETGLRIVRGRLDDIGGRFDAVVFNHSLEHVADPEAALRTARLLMKPDAVAIVRIPVVNYAWRRFRQCWVQLDAPRHLAIPTVVGMGALTTRSGMRLERVVFDSTSFQFWGSRAYERGIPLRNVDYAPMSWRWFVSAGANAVNSARAAYLNAVGAGDQAAFVCRPAAT